MFSPNESSIGVSIETTRNVHDETPVVFAGLRRVARLLAGRSRHRIPHDRLIILLLPMVRRAVRTGRGPAALLLWIRGRVGDEPLGHQTERVIRALAEDLARLLDPSDSPSK